MIKKEYPEFTIDDARKSYWRSLGEYYGYPKCCINFFLDYVEKSLSGIKELTQEQESVHKTKGFVPCQQCATKVYNKELSINDLIVNRICPKPYPYENQKHLKKYLKDEKIL